jgi:hypothetical protein
MPSSVLFSFYISHPPDFLFFFNPCYCIVLLCGLRHVIFSLDGITARRRSQMSANQLKRIGKTGCRNLT